MVYMLLPSRKSDINVAYTVFPRVYDYIIRHGADAYRISQLEYKGVLLNDDGLYTAGVYQRYNLCIRHYPNPLESNICDIWREDDLFLIDNCFSGLLGELFLTGFNIKYIKR